MTTTAANLGALATNAQGLFRDYYQSENLWSRDMAPIIQQDGLTRSYNILKSKKFAQKRDRAKQAGLREQYKLIPLDYQRVDVEIPNYDGFAIYITDRMRRAVEGPNPDIDVIRDSMQMLAPRMIYEHIDQLVTAIENLTAAPNATWTLSTSTTPVNDYIRAAKKKIHRLTGKNPNTILLSLTAFYDLAKNIGVYNGPGIANGASTTYVLGTVEEQALAQWFQRYHGLKLIVNDTVVGDSTDGTNEYVAETTGCIAFIEGGSADSCFKTYVQTVDGQGGELSGDILNFVTRVATGLDKPGEYLACDGAFKVDTVSPEYGLKFTTA